jgi:hypothetical protein
VCLAHLAGDSQRQSLGHGFEPPERQHIYWNYIPHQNKRTRGLPVSFHQGGGFFCSWLVCEILFVTVAVFCELVVAAFAEHALIHFHGSTRCASIESGFGPPLRHHLTIIYSHAPREGYICVRCASCDPSTSRNETPQVFMQRPSFIQPQARHRHYFDTSSRLHARASQ